MHFQMSLGFDNLSFENHMFMGSVFFADPKDIEERSKSDLATGF